MSAVRSDTVIGSLDDDLVDIAARTATDPLAWVLAAFPWGEPGTDLEGIDGPDEWQRDVLQQIGNSISSPSRRVQLAVASGNGAGKSTVAAWVTLWAMTTTVDTRCVTTANTAGQLATKTWPELQKWHRLSLWRDEFTWTATSFFSSDPEHAQSWRANAIPWSAERPEAFAGLHNAGRRIVFVVDEASGVDDVIWDAIAGSLTDASTDLILLAMGNPTRTSGRFFEAFHGNRHRWITRHVDTRTVRATNKAEIASWIEDYGLDSDFCKVRVLGQFPSREEAQFIDRATVEEARKRNAISHTFDPLIMGVDVARQGSDSTVIAFRKGRDAGLIPWVVMRVPDLMTIAAKVGDLAMQYRVDGVMVDAGGIGAGVYDRLVQLRVPNVYQVQFGGRDDRTDLSRAPARYAQKRSAMWGWMREWLRGGGAIPDDNDLATELTTPLFAHNARDEIQLESKDAMRKRGFGSPDKADALACTFAYEVGPSPRSGGPYKLPDYEPWSDE